MDAKTKIAELINETLMQEGFELVEIKLARYRRENRLQIYVDSDNRVNIDDCARLSKRIGPIIDDAHIFHEDNYSLEVSSPGLDRPLVTVRDFKRRVGEKVRVFFNDVRMATISGELVSVDDDSIELLMDSEKKRLGLETIRMAKIII